MPGLKNSRPCSRTEKKNQDIQLKRSRAATQKANAAKSEFLAHMGHELRTPLNTILGFGQLLEEDKELGEKQREAVQKINLSGSHLLSIINDVLDMSKIEAGRFKLEPAPTSLRELGESVISLVSDHAREKNLDLSFHYQSRLSSWGTIDEGKLRQVILNLVGNAVKFTEKGSVTLYWGDCRCGRPHCHVVMVEDTGTGISRDRQGQLFETFVQAQRHSASFEGTGLGLAICNRIVKMMGGELSMSSVVGEGSRFFFHIPIPPAEAQEPLTQSPPVESRKTEARILIVDDLPENRLLLRNCVKPICGEIREAEDGRGAVEMCRSYRPDLILMDKRMPELDGYGAAEAIKTMLGDEAPIIIMVSADALGEDAVDEAKGFVDGFLTKPINLNEVRLLVVDRLG